MGELLEGLIPHGLARLLRVYEVPRADLAEGVSPNYIHAVIRHCPKAELFCHVNNCRCLHNQECLVAPLWEYEQSIDGQVLEDP